MDKVLEALDLAIMCHKGQLRKGTDIPYIKHILDVYEILRSEGVDNETLIIGILHDTVEDSGLTLDYIRENFGDYVAYGVGIETKDKTITDYWEAKKEHVDRVKKAPKTIQLVNCADKLANLTDMIADYKKVGEKLFDRFKKGRVVLDYYQYAIDNYDLNGFMTYEVLKQDFIDFNNVLKKFDNANQL